MIAKPALCVLIIIGFVLFPAPLASADMAGGPEASTAPVRLKYATFTPGVAGLHSRIHVSGPGSRRQTGSRSGPVHRALDR